MSWNAVRAGLLLVSVLIPDTIQAARNGLVVSSIKITAAGASNTTNASYNNNLSYAAQAAGNFKAATTLNNVAVSGSGANTTNNGGLGDFVTIIQPSYDATKTLNILTLQFSGGNPGDLTSDPATVTPYYNNIVAIAQKWKALGPRTKVVVLTQFGYGWPDAATAANAVAATGLLMADRTNFDAIVIVNKVSPLLDLGTGCPAAALTADCDHLTQAGNALLVNAYEVAVNSTF